MSLYNDLLSTAPDPERRRWLEFNLATIAAERGDHAGARDRYQALHDAGISDTYGAQALLRLAKSDEKYGAELLWEVVESYPNTHSAERALQLLNTEHDDWREHVQRLERFAEIESELQDNALFFAAKLKSQHHNDQGAADIYRKLYFNDNDAGYSDDALWELAQIYAKYQDWESTLSVLEEITSNVETSWFIGDYNSTYLDDALFQTALIQMLFQNDFDSARGSFERFLELFPDSIRSDDAAWNIAQISRLAGDGSGYIDATEKFYEAYPDSRYTRRADKTSKRSE